MSTFLGSGTARGSRPETRKVQLAFGVALLLEAALCALVFALLQLGPVGSLPLFGLFAAGGFLTLEVSPAALRLALAVLLGVTLTALWLGVG